MPQAGKFAGQLGYGYRSIEAFVNAVRAINAGTATVAEFEASLPTIATTLQTTAILEAGRVSLDAHSAAVEIKYESADSFEPIGIALR